MTSLESHRTRGFIPWSKIDNWLHALRSIWISTTRPDGRPHAVPVWYVWEGHGLYFISGRHLQKAKNLARQPWIVVHAGDGDDVSIMQGPVEIMTNRLSVSWHGNIARSPIERTGSLSKTNGKISD